MRIPGILCQDAIGVASSLFGCELKNKSHRALWEADLVERGGGGGFCTSMDGGKVGHAATRVVMGGGNLGCFWIACYATGAAKKDAKQQARLLSGSGSAKSHGPTAWRETCVYIRGTYRFPLGIIR